MHIQTYEEKLVAEYLKISIIEVYKIDVFTFWYFLHEAIVYGNSQTKEGRDYLEKAWILTQTKPDKGKLRKKFGRRKK